jgi:hypothetical protein
VILEVTNLDMKTLASYVWGIDCRVPVVNEQLDVGATTYTVIRVTWRLQEKQQQGTIPATHVTLVVV